MRSHKKIFALSLLAASLAFTGCLTDDDEDEETVTVAWTADTSVSVGAQGHLTLGTALDLDAKRVLVSEVANDTANAYANMRSIDVLFAFSGAGVKLMSPVAAKAAGDVGVAANYRDSVISATKFVKVATEPANWSAAKAAYDSAATTAQVSVSAALVTGDMFIVKTNGASEYVLVTVGTITGGGANTASGTLTLNLKGM